MKNKNSGARRHALLTLTIFATYAIFGLADAARGPAIPRIQADLAVTELQIALLLTNNTAGYLASCSLTAALARRVGMKACLITGLAISAASGLIICFAPGYAVLVGAFFILNFGFGMLEISLGILSAATFTKKTGTMINLAHFFYGAGAVVSPVLSIGLMTATFGRTLLGWRYMYLIILSLMLLPAIPAFIMPLLRREHDKAKTGYAALLRNPTLWLLIAILSFGATCEIGCVAWLANFLEKAYAFTPEQAALQLTLFFVCFAGARLLAGPAADRFGLIKALVVLTAFAGTMIGLGLLLGEPGAPLLVIAGLGASPVFPMVMAVTAKLFADEIDLAMTAITTAMGIILIPANMAVGAVITWTRPVFEAAGGEGGVRGAYMAGYSFLGFCCFGACVFSILLRKRQKKAGRLV